MNERWFTVVLSILYGGLLTLALSEWVRHPGTRYLNRWLWLPIIVLFSLVGPLAYLILEKDESGRQA
jgi:hypothetical protein